jgi:hypothetical protein
VPAAALNQVRANPVAPGRAGVANLAAPAKAAAAKPVAPAKAAAANPAAPAKAVRRVNPACLDNLIRPVNLAHLVANISRRKTRTQVIQPQRQVRATVLHSSLLAYSHIYRRLYGLAGIFLFFEVVNLKL